MKIGIIGATGKAGSKILAEAVSRDHEVTAIVRNASKLQEQSVAVLEKDVFDLTTTDINGFDVVINAFGAPMGQETLHVKAGRHLIDIFKDEINTKLFVVGGAGSLFIDPEKTTLVIDTPDFPDFVKPTASNQAKNLEDLKDSTITWTFLSPSAIFDPEGPRTGKYIEGKDNLLVNEQGESYVSYADFAIAVLDEIENPKHINERFTVASNK